MAEGAREARAREPRGARGPRVPGAPLFRDMRNNLGNYTVFILPKKEDIDAAVAARRAEQAGPPQPNGEASNQQEPPPEQPANGAEHHARAPDEQGPLTERAEASSPEPSSPEPFADQSEPPSPEDFSEEYSEELETPPSSPLVESEEDPDQPDIVPPLPPRPSTITFRFGAVQVIGREPGAQPYHQVMLQHSPRPGEQPDFPPYPGVPAGVLTLTHEQLVEAHSLFRHANRVTRPEKALILAFMAGSRENPCEQIGSVFRIKLAECLEHLVQADNSTILMLCETHFQMNYNNGCWSCMKMYIPIEGAVPLQVPEGG